MKTQTDEITNSADIIDSRDIIARIEHLESECEELTEDQKDPDSENSSEEYAELLTLKAVAEQGEGYGDWAYGEALIRDSYFEDYAQELAEDCGMIQDGAKWPYTCIDWEKAASELQMDYTSVEFDGITYWMRS